MGKLPRIGVSSGRNDPAKPVRPAASSHASAVSSVESTIPYGRPLADFGEVERTSPHGRPLASADDFEPSQTRGVPLSPLPLSPPKPPLGRSRSQVLELLNEAEEPGVFFNPRESDDGLADDDEDSELNEAVEETIRLLFGVRGIHHIGPGENSVGEPVVLITATTGFGESALDAIPAEVKGFKTLLALPFELLPLRRER